jgi:hypothetical protein
VDSGTFLWQQVSSVVTNVSVMMSGAAQIHNSNGAATARDQQRPRPKERPNAPLVMTALLGESSVAVASNVESTMSNLHGHKYGRDDTVEYGTTFQRNPVRIELDSIPSNHRRLELNNYAEPANAAADAASTSSSLGANQRTDLDETNGDQHDRSCFWCTWWAPKPQSALI